MVGLLITGHGHFATGLGSSLRLITGNTENIEYVDFEADHSTETLAHNLNQAFDRLKNCDGVLVLSDLAGGSPFKTAVEEDADAEGEATELSGSAPDNYAAGKYVGKLCLLAEEELPEEDSYDGYLQLENGVGMVRLLKEEVQEELAALPGDERERHVTIATGELAAPILAELGARIREKYPRLDLQVKAVKNDFFGGKITVAGLLTGQDLKNQLSDVKLGEELLLTEHMMKSGEQVFLDDVTVEELSGALQVPVTIVKSDGKSFLNAVLGRNEIQIQEDQTEEQENF